jgi:hypothetical protein
MNSSPPGSKGQLLERVADHMGVQMTALAGVDLHRLGAGLPNPLGVVRGLLVALDHRHRPAILQVRDRAHEQRRLAGAGAGHEIEAKTPAFAAGSGWRRRRRCSWTRMSRSMLIVRSWLRPGTLTPARPLPKSIAAKAWLVMMVEAMVMAMPVIVIVIVIMGARGRARRRLPPGPHWRERP